MLKNREVKRKAREDRRSWLVNIGIKAEKAAERGNTRDQYQASS